MVIWPLSRWLPTELEFVLWYLWYLGYLLSVYSSVMHGGFFRLPRLTFFCFILIQSLLFRNALLHTRTVPRHTSSPGSCRVQVWSVGQRAVPLRQLVVKSTDCTQRVGSFLNPDLSCKSGEQTDNLPVTRHVIFWWKDWKIFFHFCCVMSCN